MVIDEDLGCQRLGDAGRSGFAELTAEVALGQVGIVLGLEVSRLARNNADWYRLLDLCGADRHAARPTRTASMTRACSTTGWCWG